MSTLTFKAQTRDINTWEPKAVAHDWVGSGNCLWQATVARFIGGDRAPA